MDLSKGLIIFTDNGKRSKVPHTVDVLVVKMTLQSIASAKFFTAAPNHLLTSPLIRLGVSWKLIILGVAQRDTTANPLCGSLKTSVCSDMTLQIWRTVITLYPFAVGAGPWIVLRKRGLGGETRGCLDVSGVWGMTNSLAGCTLSASLSRRGRSRSCRSVSFLCA